MNSSRSVKERPFIAWVHYITCAFKQAAGEKRYFHSWEAGAEVIHWESVGTSFARFGDFCWALPVSKCSQWIQFVLLSNSSAKHSFQDFTAAAWHVLSLRSPVHFPAGYVHSVMSWLSRSAFCMAALTGRHADLPPLRTLWGAAACFPIEAMA